MERIAQTTLDGFAYTVELSLEGGWYRVSVLMEGRSPIQDHEAYPAREMALVEARRIAAIASHSK